MGSKGEDPDAAGSVRSCDNYGNNFASDFPLEASGTTESLNVLTPGCCRAFVPSPK